MGQLGHLGLVPKVALSATEVNGGPTPWPGHGG